MCGVTISWESVCHVAHAVGLCQVNETENSVGVKAK